jgi:two-component system, NtrC family, nitrogen regulation response regulator NtrX
MDAILIIDDKADIRELLADILADEGYTPLCAKNAGTALKLLEENKLSLVAVLLDIWLEGSHMDGIGLLKTIKEKYEHIPVVMMSGHCNTETAASTIKYGAYDFIEKPFNTDKLLITLKRAIEAAVLTQENIALRHHETTQTKLIGTSKPLATLKAEALLAAPTNSRVLITGQSGTGKEMLARFIHLHSKRANKPFVILRAASAQEGLENELFGNTENGIAVNASVLEKAKEGTLFIDELTELSLPLQKKLLHALQDQGTTRLNGATATKHSARIIASSSYNCLEAIEAGTLDQSLYYRLNVVSLHVPSLQERREDIRPLFTHFINGFADQAGLEKIAIAEEVYPILEAYNWQGNVRQLRNLAEWLVIMRHQHQTINANMLPLEFLKDNDDSYQNLNPFKNQIISKQLKEARELFEKEYITIQLNRFSGNISKTAAFIGMERTALHRKIRFLNIKLYQIS